MNNPHPKPVGATLLDPKAAPVLTTYAHLTGMVADGLGSLVVALPHNVSRNFSKNFGLPRVA